MYKVTIIANGDFPRHSIPLLCIQEANHIVCCDGALVKLLNASITIHDGQRIDIVGDGDSLRQAGFDTSHYHFHQITEQDDNDLTKAFNWTLKQHSSPLQITIVGATGLREDHTIANVALLMDYYDLLENQKLQATIIMMTDHGQFIPHSGKTVIASYKGQQVSIFAHDARNLRSRGLKWPIYDFKKYWQGTLNEALSDHFGIQAEGNYLVFLNY